MPVDLLPVHNSDVQDLLFLLGLRLPRNCNWYQRRREPRACSEAAAAGYAQVASNEMARMLRLPCFQGTLDSCFLLHIEASAPPSKRTHTDAQRRRFDDDHHGKRQCKCNSNSNGLLHDTSSAQQHQPPTTNNQQPARSNQQPITHSNPQPTTHNQQTTNKKQQTNNKVTRLLAAAVRLHQEMWLSPTQGSKCSHIDRGFFWRHLFFRTWGDCEVVCC